LEHPEMIEQLWEARVSAKLILVDPCSECLLSVQHEKELKFKKMQYGQMAQNH
jgi:hypothetical protein